MKRYPDSDWRLSYLVVMLVIAMCWWFLGLAVLAS